MVTPAGVAEPSAGIRTDVVGIAPTTSVQIPVDGSATLAGVATCKGACVDKISS